jgi:hypothetical protein
MIVGPLEGTASRRVTFVPTYDDRRIGRLTYDYRRL